MKPRYFNTIMPAVNHKWAAEVLGMEVNPKKGPDLISKFFNVELKFTLVGESCNAEKYPRAWTVLEHQMNYGMNGKEHYWGLGTYSLLKPVAKINSRDDLEKCVLERELWIVPWNFMDQYRKSETRGISKTTGDEWHNIFRYPKMKDLPKTIRVLKVRKGKLNITQGTNIDIL